MSRRSLCLALLTAAIAIGCEEKREPPPDQDAARSEPPVASPSTRVALTSPPRVSSTGIGFRLSDAEEQAEALEARKVAAGTPLPKAEAARLVGRLPKLVEEEVDAEAEVFSLPARSIPAPRPGTTVELAFPPDTGPPPPEAAPTGPLQIERFAPEGEVPVTPSVSLTFSEPMVPAASLGALAREALPARISPEVEGAWSWLGTQTLVFHPAKPLPMATAFTVTVAAGTEAMSGQTLEEAFQWNFSTPAPTLKTRLPRGGSAPPLPVIFLAFDQLIDPELIFRSVELFAGDKKIGARLATREEAEADVAVRRAIQRAGEGRWLAIRPTRRLPAETDVQVRVAEGVKGLEGPLATKEEQHFGFKTFGALRLRKAGCGRSECRPLTPFWLDFSNRLDDSHFDPKQMKVSPEIPDLKIETFGSRVVLRGRTKGRTEYRVTVEKSLTDVFGQTLAEPVSVSMEVGPAHPHLFPAERDMVVLDPAGPPSFPVHSINHPALRARVYAVTPKDWKAYEAWRKSWKRPADGAPPGRLVLDEVLVPKEAPDELVATPIDLSAALQQGVGHVVLHVMPADEDPADTDDPGAGHRGGPGVREGRELIVWLQATKLGLHSFLEKDRVTAWVTRLADGAPLDGVEVSLLGSVEAASTKDGLASLPLAGGAYPLVAKQGNDTAFLAGGWYLVESFAGQQREKEARWFVFDDRGMYKPGEEVHIKGWVRMDDLGRGGDLGSWKPHFPGRSVEYRVEDPRGAALTSGRASIDDQGAFDFSFVLPSNVNLGRARVGLELTGSARQPIRGTRTHLNFSIQEFRKPEYAVETRLSEGPHLVGAGAVATVNASYYAGGPLPEAPVEWKVEQTSVSFRPPKQSGFHFGHAPKWFRWNLYGGREDKKEETWSAHTDLGGSHQLQLHFDAVEPAYPFRLSLRSSVEDLNRQRWSGHASMLVHPSDRYVGIRLARNFVRAGESLDVELVVADLDGARVAGRPVEVRAARLGTQWSGRKYLEDELDVQRCQVESSAGTTPVRCSLPTTLGGHYRVTAVVTDEYGRKNQSAIETWVLGGETPAQRGLDPERVTVIPDKEEYLPGETATLLVISPLAPAEGVLTVRRQGVLHLERFRMEETSKTFQVKLDDSMVPNVEIAVDLAGAVSREGGDGEADPSLSLRPAYASGDAQLKLLPTTRTLAVEARPRAPKVAPGGRTTIEVEVRDPKGRPARKAEVALIVVDEAMLALSDYQTPDPLAAFYPARPADVWDFRGRAHLLLADVSPELAEPPEPSGDRRREERERGGSAGLLGGLGGSEGAGGRGFGLGGLGARGHVAEGVFGRPEEPARRSADAHAPILTRVDFTSLALFAPRVRTDRSGRASVSVKLPDNLTRYRVMAVASAGDNLFGSTESTITARLPLMVRPSAPRFLYYGDAFDLAVVLQNQTDAPVDAAVVARASNAVIADAARRVRVPANDRVELRFPATTLQTGKARFQFGVEAPGFADASEIELPVHAPATTEALATYGVVDSGALAQPVRLPKAVFSQFGGLEISTSSTQLQALTDAVLYLARYPYDCSEQLASRVLAIASLRDVLSAFRAEGLPPPEELEASMKRDLETLAFSQHPNGGWSFWPGQAETWPYVSVHVAHALVRAKEKGYEPDAEMLQRAMEYLRRVEAHIPGWYGARSQRSLRAYSLYVRWRAGDADPAQALRLIDEAGGVEQLPLEAIGWLWPILSNPSSGNPADTVALASIRRHVANRVDESADTAHFVTGYGHQNWLLLHSSRRTDGLLLEALIHDQPDSSLIPKLVKGLLDHRRAGRWRNTQENAFVLLALDRYFNTYEKATPDFVARVWLGEQFAGERAFRGRGAEQSELRVPMQWLATHAAGSQDLILGKEGPGRLYYRIGMRYAPTDRRLPPVDRGFGVTRVYEGTDRPEDVRRDEDGTWRIRLGARVRVRLSMVAPGRRHHVALVDPLPAGLEPLNPALAVTGDLPKDPQAEKDGVRNLGLWCWLWSRTWYEHHNLRDHRAEAFASRLYAGVWDYSYVTTATTPGTFIAPPPKAEEMYSPETFGRGAQDQVIIE